MCHLFDSQKAKAASSFMVMVNNIGICIAEIIIFKSALNRILAQVAPESIG
jgi:hypothetical protein